MTFQDIMNDKEKEILFKSIIDFSKFFAEIENRNDIFLSETIVIKFKQEEKSFVEILINNTTFKMDYSKFDCIINEIKFEKLTSEKNNKLHQKKVEEEKIGNEIFRQNNNTYKVHKEYIKKMYFATDVASSYGLYLKKLKDLIRVLNGGNILIIENKIINSKYELIEYLKIYGFNSVEEDLNL